LYTYVGLVVVQHWHLWYSWYLFVEFSSRILHPFTSHVRLCHASSATVSFLRHFISSLTQRETVFVYNDDFVPTLWTETITWATPCTEF